MSSPFNHAIGARLRSIRKLRGLTQTQLAERLGVSFQQVQKYESGANTMSFERICGLSALLDVPLAEWAEQAKPPAEIDDSRQELALLKAFHAIGNEERRALLCQVARAFASSPMGSLSAAG